MKGFIKSCGQKRRWPMIVTCLACVVVFCTVYALVLPAAALEKDQILDCTYEVHKHTRECYDTEEHLICGYADYVVHTHDKDICYDEDGNLICPLEEIKEHEHADSCYADARGELICQNKDEEHRHTDDCYETEKVLECDKKEVRLHTHADECYKDITDENDEVIGQELICGLVQVEEHVHDDTCMIDASPDDEQNETGIELDDSFEYETDTFSLTLNVKGTAVAEGPETRSEETDDSTQENVNAEQEAEEASRYALDVTVLDENSETYMEASDYLAQTVNEEDLIDLSVLEFHLYEGEKELDLSACTLTAQVTPKEAALETGRRTSEEEAGEGVTMSVLKIGETEVEEADTALLPMDEETMPVLRAALTASSNILGVARASTSNPSFTVQYYANLNTLSTSGDGKAAELSAIDTSDGKLPVNGTAPSTKTIYLEESSNRGKYQVASMQTLTEVYSQSTYQYTSAPGLSYFNKLSENSNYELKKIWVLESGKDSSSTNEKDWTVYDANASFTNNSESADANTIFITDNTVIRLVYDTTSGSYTNAVNFYDYDITEDGTHTYKGGKAQGINNPGNYSGGGAKLAFGNANTGTGLYTETWNGNFLNRGNGNGFGNVYSGCTFGLVTGLRDGKLQYAAGITAPNLFDEGSAIGKTSYDKGEYTLGFNRNGDTYTLSSVNGTGVTGLESFSHLTHYVAGDGKTYGSFNIWTNNFWPMDSVKKSRDGKTGTYVRRSGSNTSEESYTGIEGPNYYPPSDDSIPHNNMFGMQYAVQFTLTPDYTGPLEYLFYGDDDMWVFLDDRLVCDIGGVHSSVGEYVDLWDYLTKGEAGTHTLTFYYTERGLSGSSCWMQFTLPSVSSVTPGQSTGALTLEKQVTGVGAEENKEEFSFKVDLTGSSGNVLSDTYAYVRTDASGNTVSTGNITSGGTFKLKKNEKIVINGLPDGTNYVLTETGTNKAIEVSYTVNGGNPVYEASVSGSIRKDTASTVNIICTNEFLYQLPNTGGTGIIMFTISGLLLMAGAVGCGYKMRRRRERRIRV